MWKINFSHGNLCLAQLARLLKGISIHIAESSGESIMESKLCIGIVILIYLAAMIIVGVVFSKGNDDSGDFYLGGRHLGPFVTAMSAEA